MSLVLKIATYHSKYLLLEGCIFGAKSKLTRMGVYLMYIPIRGNELGDEDAPLSQQIFVVRSREMWHIGKVIAMG